MLVMVPHDHQVTSAGEGRSENPVTGFLGGEVPERFGQSGWVTTKQIVGAARVWLAILANIEQVWVKLSLRRRVCQARLGHLDDKPHECSRAAILFKCR